MEMQRYSRDVCVQTWAQKNPHFAGFFVCVFGACLDNQVELLHGANRAVFVEEDA